MDTTNWFLCPRCSAPFDRETGATSRRDNATRICPPCGIEEALIDFAVAFGRPIPGEWAVREGRMAEQSKQRAADLTLNDIRERSNG